MFGNVHRLRYTLRVFFLSFYRCIFNTLINNINLISIGGDMLFRRNLIITLLSLFVFSFACFAQNASYLDSLKGKYALQFQISNNFNLTNFQGSTFSGKYHFGCKSAVRLGLSLDFGDVEQDATTNQYDTVNVATNNIEQNSFSMTIRTQYIRYFIGTDEVAFYGGTGPFVNYSTLTRESKLTGSNDDRHLKETSDSFSIGLDLILGVEWFLSENMSLSAEYGLNFSYRTRTREYNTDDIISTNSDETLYNISGNNINFGISVYF